MYIPDDKGNLPEGSCELTGEDTSSEHTCAFFEARGLHHAFKTAEDRKREKTKH